jgi:hypothetical protein
MKLLILSITLLILSNGIICTEDISVEPEYDEIDEGPKARVHFINTVECDKEEKTVLKNLLTV